MSNEGDSAPRRQRAGPPPVIDRICVVVPAFNEAASIAQCLRSTAAAAAACALPVRLIVVADSCEDATADVARSSGAEVIEVAFRNVGMVRAAGCRAALAGGHTGLWLAHTDADSTVTEDWLVTQLRYARAGIDMVAGSVQVDDWHDWPAELQTTYEGFYQAAVLAGHRHVHGCNLGLSAAAYERLGGFPPLQVGEDQSLVSAAQKDNLTVAFAKDLVVHTSGRRHARVLGGGFHAFLATMAGTVAPRI